MADGTARFAIKLDDETSGAANAAAGALEQMRQKIEADQKALKQLEAVMAASKKAAFDSKTNYIGMAAAIQTKRNAIAGSLRDFQALGGSFEKLREPLKSIPQGFAKVAAASAKSGESFDSMSRAAKKIGLDLPDTVGDLTGAFGSLSGALLTGTAGLVAFAAAAVGLVGGAIFGLIKMAISSQEELEGMSQAVINVAKNSPIARSEIAKLADDLEKTGLRGEALEVALDKAAKKKYGKEAEKSMMGLSVQMQKAKENITLLFTGVNTNPLLEAVAGLLKFLDTSTVEGQALKTLIETLLNPIIEGIGKAAPMAKQFFQGMIIGALQVAIAILLVKKRFEELVGYKLDLGQIDWTTVGQGAMFVAAALGLVVVAIGALIGWVVLMTAGVIAVGAAIVALAVLIVGALAGIPAAISSINNFIVSRVAAMVDAGFQFAAGLAEGIRNGLSEVINAAAGLAGGAVKAVKDKLQMHSPSKIGLDVGGNFGESIAAGAEDSGGSVERASAGLGEALVPPRTGSALQPAASGGATIRIEQLVVQGVEGADDPMFAAKLAEVLQQAAAMAGMAGATP